MPLVIPLGRLCTGNQGGSSLRQQGTLLFYIPNFRRRRKIGNIDALIRRAAKGQRSCSRFLPPHSPFSILHSRSGSAVLGSPFSILHSRSGSLALGSAV